MKQKKILAFVIEENSKIKCNAEEFVTSTFTISPSSGKKSILYNVL